MDPATALAIAQVGMQLIGQNDQKKLAREQMRKEQAMANQQQQYGVMSGMLNNSSDRLASVGQTLSTMKRGNGPMQR